MTEKPINALPVGTRLQSDETVYTITDVIGAGGFGITYKALMPTVIGHIRSKAHIAVKEHFPATDCERSATTSSISFSSAARDRVMTSLRDFVEEAKCLQRIAGLHPNIVNVNEVFEANNTAYYVMEYIEGTTLKQYVKARGKLSVEETLSIMMPIIEAVGTLHKNRFTHLDIKPSNIMLSVEDGSLRPVLIDFGLAKHYNPDGSQTATVISSGFSDGYAPIEQYSGITRFSPAVDVYALGATMLFCLTGEKPPRSIKLQSPVALDSLIPKEMPSKLHRLLMFAMAFNASDRLPDARQLYLDLEPIAVDESVDVKSKGMPVYKENSDEETILPPPPPAPPTPRPQPTPPPPPAAAAPESVPQPKPTPIPAWLWFVGGLITAAIVAGCILIFANMGRESDMKYPVLDDASDVNIPDSMVVEEVVAAEPESVDTFAAK